MCASDGCGLERYSRSEAELPMMQELSKKIEGRGGRVRPNLGTLQGLLNSRGAAHECPRKKREACPVATASCQQLNCCPVDGWRRPLGLPADTDQDVNIPTFGNINPRKNDTTRSDANRRDVQKMPRRSLLARTVRRRGLRAQIVRGYSPLGVILYDFDV
jgi:hypothetical protein